MNQLKKYLAIMMTIFAFTPLQRQATAKEAQTNGAIESQKVMKRLNEIHTMDKTHLTLAEKKVLKKEVLNIKKQLGPGGGIYISAGALIIIILILIVLF